MEGLLSFLHPEVLFAPLVVQMGLVSEPFRGHDGVRSYLEQIPTTWGPGRLHLIGVHEVGQVVVAQVDIDTSFPDGGGRLSTTYVGRVEDGRIIELATFADLPAARRALRTPDPAAEGLPREPLKLQLPAIPSSVPFARAAVVSYLRTLGARGETRDGAALAVTEAVTNAVVHAYRDVPSPGDVFLHATADPAGVTVSVTDDGCGMLPRYDSPGLGLGLGLMSHHTAELTVVGPPQRTRGTHVRMRFALRS